MEFNEGRINIANIAAVLLSRSEVNLPTWLDDEIGESAAEFDQEAWPYLLAALRMANTLLDNAVERRR